ncbi:sensor histidine kinase [Burkholderia plantarii]|uniref:sensor histidine kinase n=1 Tax=Burkholderia plantarii TaxID=41899 RepID=UPI0006D8B8D3|nr:ATP-binding protein [Burkholderia plantarii]GLZ16804.1 hypothetical protein Bpla01_03340 [Burkholderia plantarii]
MRETRNFRFAQIPIGDVVHDVKAWLARKADARQVTPGIDDGAAPRQILADRSALFILLKNLVDNAIDVSPDAAEVVIRCAADGLDVIDHGPGIHSERRGTSGARDGREARRAGFGVYADTGNDIGSA